MGLFSSSKKSTTNQYTTQNFDQSQNLADSTLNQLESGAVLADEVGSYSNIEKTGSENVALTGSNNVYQGFSEAAAGVVNRSLDVVESITGANLAGALGQPVSTEAKDKVATTQNTNFSKLLVFGALGVGAFFLIKKKAK